MQLYLNTYGAYLHLKDALFEVRVPQSDGPPLKRHFAAHKVTSIILTTSAALSTDAIQLALQHNIDIVFADAHGFPTGRIWHGRPGSTTKIRKRQLEASLNAEGLQWVIGWLDRKLDNQIAFIKNLKKHRAQRAEFLSEKIARIESLRDSVRLQEKAERVEGAADTLRGLEGTAGRLFFETLNEVLPRAHQFVGRSYRPARDPFNAFLNYGYGVLYNRLEKALMVAGLDPYLGFMHRDDYNQKSMVFDFIEPYRIYVDSVVFRLFAGKRVNQSHTGALANGVTLNTEGKQLLIEKLNHYLEVEKIRYRGRNQSRANGLQMDAHLFANALIGKNGGQPQIQEL